MSERKNAGYAITDSVHVGDTEFVIGEHPRAPSPFVTWECAGGENYFWGHYFADRRSAVKDLLERAQQELEYSEPARQPDGKGQSPYNAKNIEFESFDIFDRDALFTDCRIDRSTVPSGMYAYDIRHCDDGDPAMLEKHVGVNFYGTVILNQPISLGRYGCKEIGPDDYGFREEDRLTLADFMKTHPPKKKEPER